MTAVDSTPVEKSIGFRERCVWVAAPLAAAFYPLPLVAFHAAESVAKLGSGIVSEAAWTAAGLALAAAFSVPGIALVSARKLAKVEAPSEAELRARRIAFLAVATPALYTLVGVILFMLGRPSLDGWILATFWLVLAGTVETASRETRPMPQLKPSRALPIRMAHGIVALGIILVFLAAHLTNHLTGVLGPDVYNCTMSALRHLYRSRLVEPVLLAGFLFQVASGVYLAWRQSARSSDVFQTLQIASGIFLMFFVISHVNAVIILARMSLHIDPNWAFATGGPAGLIVDSWNIRLVPYYTLAVFFVLSHLFAGLRSVVLEHRGHLETADAIVTRGTVAAAIVSVVIMLGMCGLRVHFAWAG